MKRRKFLVGTATLAAGVTSGTLSFARPGADGDITLRISSGKDLSELSGKALRAALLKSLSIEAKLGSVVPARLYVVRFEGGKPVDRFVSRSFRVGEGRMAFPGEMHFPGEMLFPGEMHFPGEMLFPGEMHVPTGDATGLAMEMAAKALAKSSQGNGLFLVVLAEEGKVSGTGIGLGTERG